jgi:threonine synthase
MTSVTYSSTRGGQKNLSFREVVMVGLAHDGGLFVPDSFPRVSSEELEAWRSLSFADLSVNVIAKFVKDDQVPRDKLEDIVKRSCAAFRSEEVTPIVIAGGVAVLVRSTGNERKGAIVCFLGF